MYSSRLAHKVPTPGTVEVPEDVVIQFFKERARKQVTQINQLV